jgi:hypothetical protein
MTDRVVSFKTGRKPVILSPVPAVLTVIGILGAFAKASNAIIYPTSLTSREKDEIFCGKIKDLSIGHKDLTVENLKLTREYLEASVKFSKDCKIAGDEAVDKAGELIPRELTVAECAIFESFDEMGVAELNEMKAVIDLFSAKLRASMENNDAVNPDNVNNESLLMIVEHIVKGGEKSSKFTSKRKRVEKKSARFTMGAGLDSQEADDPHATESVLDLSKPL